MNGRLTFLLVIVSLAISYSTWTYSFRMVKPPVKTVQKPSTIGSKHSDSSKKPHRSTLLTTDLSTQSLRAIIAKFPTAFISTKLPRRKQYVQSWAGGAVALPLHRFSVSQFRTDGPGHGRFSCRYAVSRRSSFNPIVRMRLLQNDGGVSLLLVNVSGFHKL
jgi:hypothetical protein